MKIKMQEETECGPDAGLCARPSPLASSVPPVWAELGRRMGRIPGRWRRRQTCRRDGVVVAVAAAVAGRRRESSRFCPKNMLIKLQRAKVCLLVTRLS